MTTLEYLTQPAAAPHRLAAGERALTRAERDWLAAVPADPTVERCGAVETRGIWAGSFFRRYVRRSLEMGLAQVSTQEGVMVATFPDRTYRVIPRGDQPADRATAAAIAQGAAAVVSRGPARRLSFFATRNYCPGTHASHSAPND